MFNIFKFFQNKNQSNDINLESKGFNLIEKSLTILDSKDCTVDHEVKKQLFEDYMVPAHEPRVASNLYTKTHHDMIVVRDMPCYICGVSNSTLNNTTKNRFGSTQIETHHAHCEWSLANAVDWDIMKKLHPDFNNWDAVNPNDPTTYFIFVDSEYNLLPLCDICHRGNRHGIHAIEHAVWQAQKFVKADFKFIVEDQSKGLGNDFVDDLS